MVSREEELRGGVVIEKNSNETIKYKCRKREKMVKKEKSIQGSF